MAFFKDSNGNEVELPKLTVGMLERMEQVKGLHGIRDKAEAMFAIVSELFTDDYIAGKLGSLSIDDVDAVELISLFQGIDAAYGREMRKEQTKAVSEELKEAQSLLAQSRKMVDDAKQLSAIESNKGNVSILRS